MDIRRVGFESAAAQALVGASLAEMLERYDGRGGSGAEPRASDFGPPNGVLLVGFNAGVPVACGGVCRYDATTGEIRRIAVLRDGLLVSASQR